MPGGRLSQRNRHALRVLRWLVQAQGRVVPESDLCATASLPPPLLLRAVETLRRDDFEIHGEAGGGYRLVDRPRPER